MEVGTKPWVRWFLSQLGKLWSRLCKVAETGCCKEIRGAYRKFPENHSCLPIEKG